MLKILHITDTHGDLSSLESIKRIVTDNGIDILLHSGDFGHLVKADLLDEEKLANIQQQINSFCEEFPNLKCISGNHDPIPQLNNPAFVSTSAEIAEGLSVIASHGSASVVTQVIPKEQMRVNYEFWEGLPHGPMFDDYRDGDWISQFYSKLIAQFYSALHRDSLDKLKFEFKERCEIGKSQNEELAKNLNDVPDGNQVIVFAHHGPLLSQTVFDDYRKGFNWLFSSGSPGVQQFIDDHQSRVIMCLHGHSHFPLQQSDILGDVVVCNPGTANKTMGKGCYGIYSLAKEQNRWKVLETKFGEI